MFFAEKFMPHEKIVKKYGLEGYLILKVLDGPDNILRYGGWSYRYYLDKYFIKDEGDGITTNSIRGEKEKD